MDLPLHIAQLTGSAEHKALVMVIERLDAIEANMDALRSSLEKVTDPLASVATNVATEDPLMHISRLWSLHTSQELNERCRWPYSPKPWEGQPYWEKLYEVEVDVSCPEVQTKLKERGVQLYRRRYDLLKCQLSHQTFYGTPDNMPIAVPDKWYVSFTDRVHPKDEVSTWERVV